MLIKFVWVDGYHNLCLPVLCQGSAPSTLLCSGLRRGRWTCVCYLRASIDTHAYTMNTKVWRVHRLIQLILGCIYRLAVIQHSQSLCATLSSQIVGVAFDLLCFLSSFHSTPCPILSHTVRHTITHLIMLTFSFSLTHSLSRLAFLI